jgi:uncharacterized protein (DUF305 family)
VRNEDLQFIESLLEHLQTAVSFASCDSKVSRKVESLRLTFALLLVYLSQIVTKRL